MICDIANVKMYKDSYRAMAFDDDSVPFGQVKITLFKFLKSWTVFQKKLIFLIWKKNGGPKFLIWI